MTNSNASTQGTPAFSPQPPLPPRVCLTPAQMCGVEIERRKRARAVDLRAKPLGEFIRAISPSWESPVHLDPNGKGLLNVFARIRSGETIRVLVSTPPQHGKSQTIEHGIAQDLLVRPDQKWAYCTYESDK